MAQDHEFLIGAATIRHQAYPALGRARPGTAEIAVLNREAVALAADSAVTLNTALGPKIYQSANKIFGLSRTGPVGVIDVAVISKGDGLIWIKRKHFRGSAMARSTRSSKTKITAQSQRTKKFRTIEEVRKEYYPKAARRDRAARQRREEQLLERQSEFALVRHG